MLVNNGKDPKYHYVIVTGVREDGGGYRYFKVYDPDIDTAKEYTELQLHDMMEISIATVPFDSLWLYKYPDALGVRRPAFEISVN